MDLKFGMIPTLQLPNTGYSSIPTVSGSGEAKQYPSAFNSEIVLKDSNDDTLMYIKKTDVNGAISVKRYRYYEDPEPTQQEINDERYITKEDFEKQFTNFKNDILNTINKQHKGKYNNGPRTNDTNKEDV